jgi:hypothetical protein
MDLLEEIKRSLILDYNQLISWLKDYKRPRDKISELLKSNRILRIKKGLYLASDYKGQSLCPLANLIYGPSYISKEMALSIHGMIPERVYEYTCMTLAKKKLFETPVGRFSYQPLPLPYYSEELLRLDENGKGFLLASKEKALCDLFYAKKFNTPADLKDYLKGLRIEKEPLDKLSLPRIKRLAECSKRPSLELLYRSLEKTR